MKLITGFLLAVSSLAYSSVESLLGSLAELESIRSEPVDAPGEYMRESDSTLRIWGQLEQDQKARLAMKMALFHYHRSGYLAASGEYERAAEELQNEARLQSEFGGRLEYSTKTSDAFFEEMIELQALLTAETGKNPLEGLTGHLLSRDGDRFIAARFELGKDIMGIDIPDMGENESLVTAHELEKYGESYKAGPARWFVVPTGPLPEALASATREMIFDKDGALVARPVRGVPGAGKLPRAMDEGGGPLGAGEGQTTRKHSGSEGTESRSPKSSTWMAIACVVVVAALLARWAIKRKQ